MALVFSFLPVQGLAAAETVVFCQTPEDWEQCLVYWWGDMPHPEWPGVPMEQNPDGIWVYSVPVDAQGLIFNNGNGRKTGDLQVPTDNNVMFVFERHFWSTYGKTEIGELYTVLWFSVWLGLESR